MSIYDYKPPVKEEAKSTEQNVSTPESQNQNQEEQKMILVDGPLSEIYTKALDTVYSQSMNENISQETQQTDSVMIANAGKYLSEKESDDLKDNGVYVYVTDDQNLAKNGMSDALNNLRLALDMKNVKARVLAVEHRGIKTSRVNILVNFAEANGMQVFHNRVDTVNYLKRI